MSEEQELQVIDFTTEKKKAVKKKKKTTVESDSKTSKSILI